jgi:hypothetical protein
MALRLFHFSDAPDIDVFVPRAVRTPAKRAPGLEWLNGPLVWAIDDWHQPMYLFPRDCPRILLWRTPSTRTEDAEHYFGACGARIVAYVEKRWYAAIAATTLYRYELPPESFKSLDDAGMWVSKREIRPLDRDEIRGLPEALNALGTELRILPDLAPLKGVWATSLHASGIRLRNAVNWNE